MVIAELDQLEAKIRTAGELLTSLRDGKRALELESQELRERVRSLEAEVARRESEDLKPRLTSLEEERAALIEERRLVAKRVEDLLAKFSQLEKSLHA
jgi:FtsZ-binding cell division protein ZapB